MKSSYARSRHPWWWKMRNVFRKPRPTPPAPHLTAKVETPTREWKPLPRLLDPDDKALSVSQAARFLSVPRGMLEARLIAGGFPVVEFRDRFGRIYFLRSELERWGENRGLFYL